MDPPLELTYVLPFKASPDVDRVELTGYLQELADLVDEVIVVDGSDPSTFAAGAEAWGAFTKHVAPDADLRCTFGKVCGVITGVRAAAHEKVVLADDDVRYDRSSLARIASLLDTAELVRPQNHWPRPLPWHAVWDSARTLINRAIGADFPGTLAVRKSFFLEIGAYDGDVLFENLELIRTVAANGGRVSSPLDLYVPRLAPTTKRFLSQRVRQAYDDFALPVRMAAWLAVLPFAAWTATRRRWRVGAAAAAIVVGVAEIGRSRASGRRFFPTTASLAAPLWVLERGLCAWLAVIARWTGGVRYGDVKIKKAANPLRALAVAGPQAVGRALRR